jgi:hypothetical protein
VASKRAIRRRSCEGKRGYPSLAAALRVATRLATKQDEDLTAYRCGFCQKHHVGHTPWKVRQAIEAKRNGLADEDRDGLRISETLSHAARDRRR